MKTVKYMIVLAFLFLTIKSYLYSQPYDNSVWHLSGQTQDGLVKVYLVTGESGICNNALVFKNRRQWDTLYLSEYGSKFTCFLDSCELRTAQIDGQGLDEIIITWKYQRPKTSKESQWYTINDVWNLDTHTKIFYVTTDYYRMSKEIIYGIDTLGNILDSTSTIDSCTYSCDFNVNEAGIITIKNVKQTGHCPDNQLWKRREGIYVYKDGYCIWSEKNSN